MMPRPVPEHGSARGRSQNSACCAAERADFESAPGDSQRCTPAARDSIGGGGRPSNDVRNARRCADATPGRAVNHEPMKISASAEGRIDAPAHLVYRVLADFRTHHPRILPPEFGPIEIETGGVGAGTVHRFTLTLAGRTTAYRVRVGEPEPGRVLIESDPSRRMLTTFTVDPEAGGSSWVRIETRWFADGLDGIIQRLAAPAMLRRLYADELRRLNDYAKSGVGAPEREPRRHQRGAAAA